MLIARVFVSDAYNHEIPVKSNTIASTAPVSYLN